MLERYSLAQLLDPISPETFLAEYWEKKPLLIKRGKADYFRDLLSLEQLDGVITSRYLHYPNVFITNALRGEIKHSEYTYPSQLIDVAALYQQFADGGTIVFSNLEGHLPSMANFCRSLERDMSTRFQANIYLTPGGSQGFNTHYDSHDVFVVQVEGSKHWRIYDTPVDLPLHGQRFDPRTAPPPGEITMEFDLEAGDLFYLPRGVMHDAPTNDVTSLHITVGLIFTSWAELMLEAVAKVTVEEPGFHRSLPAGFAKPSFDREEARAYFRELIAKVVERASFDEALDHFADDLISTRVSLLSGQLEQVGRLSEITLESEVGARPNLIYHLREEGEHLWISCYGGHTRMPLHAEEPLRFALDTERFKVNDLPGELDDAGKIVLVQRLVREGLVRVLY